MLLGDSITAGVVSGPPGPSWELLAAAALAESYDIVNVAAGGTSAFYWAPDTPCPGICPDADTLFEQRAAEALPADVVTVLLGTNDAVGFFLDEPTPVSDWDAYMRDILDALFERDVGVVLLMSAPIANLGDGAAALARGYRDRVMEICTELPAVLCGPDLIELLDPETDFAPGDVHPNASGHAKIAEAVVARLRSIPEPGSGLLLAAALAVAMRRRRSPSPL